MARIRTIKPEFWPNTNGPWHDNECHLYVVQEGRGSRCKIGIANHPIRRLSMLRSGNPRPLRLAAVWGGTRADCIIVEAAVFERAADHRLEGEWFALPPDSIIEFINDRFTEDGV